MFFKCVYTQPYTSSIGRLCNDKQIKPTLRSSYYYDDDRRVAIHSTYVVGRCTRVSLAHICSVYIVYKKYKMLFNFHCITIKRIFYRVSITEISRNLLSVGAPHQLNTGREERKTSYSTLNICVTRHNRVTRFFCLVYHNVL